MKKETLERANELLEIIENIKDIQESFKNGCSVGVFYSAKIGSVNFKMPKDLQIELVAFLKEKKKDYEKKLEEL